MSLHTVGSTDHFSEGKSASSLSHGKCENEEGISPSMQKPMLKTKPHNLLTRKVYIHQIRNGIKTVEGRIFTKSIEKYKTGDLLRFYYMSNASDDVTCRILGIRKYLSFRDMVKGEGPSNCIPGITSEQAAVSVYHSIPKYQEKALKCGVVAIHLEPIKTNKV